MSSPIIDTSDPDVHEVLAPIDLWVTGRTRDFFTALAAHYHSEDGYPWTPTLAMRRCLETMAATYANMPEGQRLVMGGSPRGPEREILAELVKRSGVPR